MALLQANFSAGIGARYSLAVGDDLNIARGTMVWSTNAVGVVAAGSNHNVSVSGMLYGATSGVVMGDGTAFDAGNHLVVEATGQVRNNLLPTGNGAAVMVISENATILNRGLIHGSVGVWLNTSSLLVGAATIDNFGVIRGGAAAVRVDALSGEKVVVHNSGVLVGTYAFEGGAAVVHELINTGTLRGLVRFGDQSDLYDGRAGRFIGGSILGLFGNDTFLPGLSAEKIDGGDGVDVLNFESSAGVKLSMISKTYGTGLAKGDEYIGIEDVRGSLLGADDIIGSNSANTLIGNGGNDTLQGLAGNDVIIGGAGKDRVSGGTGNDNFIFNSLTDIGDIILDFINGFGSDDRITVNAAAFGGGLVAGALSVTQFRVGTTNSAGDLDDRFILRTTDKTLWFDADGLGGGAPKLLADLQQTASLSAADIFLI